MASTSYSGSLSMTSGSGGWHQVSSGNWVLWRSEEFDDIKDWMKLAHGIGEVQTVSILPYSVYDWVGS
jgi:hypothetical protein